MAQRIQLRRDTAANWTSVNPTLAQGEMGIETDTKFFKFGDGTTAWTSLAYHVPATRSISTTSTATLTPNVNLYDLFVISAQAVALNISNPTGTAILGNGFMIDIEDNGTARAITYGNLYTSTFVTLPTTTILGKRMKLVFQYNGTNWELLNVINEQ